jgi:phage terminase large subunit-like protein
MVWVGFRSAAATRPPLLARGRVRSPCPAVVASDRLTWNFNVMSAAEKQASRDADGAALASGAKSRDDLRWENDAVAQSRSADQPHSLRASPLPNAASLRVRQSSGASPP